jgi:hypothetical protein
VIGARKLGLLVGGAAVAVVLCAGCRDTAAPTPTGITVGSTGTTAGSTGTSSPEDNQLGSELDDLQSTLDNVQSQVNGDSAP